MDELFVEFDPEPLGAASLAQVHRATLKDGTVVAVKVQHPRVKAHTFVDMKTMEVGTLAEVLSKIINHNMNTPVSITINTFLFILP